MDALHSCPNCMAVFNPSISKLAPFSPTPAPNDILETNNPPLESEIPLLQDFVSRGRARMTVLDSRLALLQSSFSKLLEERDELDIEIRKYEGALSPLRRLPTEIISLIFTFTLRLRVNDESAPWTVSAVCARWRATVIFQPCFWTSIDYNHDVKSTNRFRLETQLQRSSELPLTIDFSTEDTSTLSSGDTHMLQILCKHARRWKRISVSGPGELYFKLATFIQDQLALLRKLTIEMEYDEVPPLDIFANTPSLQEVTVNKLLWPYDADLVLPWSQLLRYFGSNTWDGHLRALQGATNLVDCSLEIQGTSALPLRPILLPHLLRLSLSQPEFLECLETPALLELYCDYNAAIHPFLRRQSCKLQKLAIGARAELFSPAAGAQVDSAGLAHIIDAVPTITNLAFSHPLPIEFARALSSPTVAPALEYFSTVLPLDSPDVQNHFMQVIESRWQAGRLKSVKVYCTDYAPRILDRMEVLQSEGLEFVDFNWYSLFKQDAVPWEFQIRSED
ncbi:hypothetical protein B0H13DRAFT_1088406 [Mycena leptocephala]|nr:hypothetical protein B0H13DRAFT_1088406 [Mycena leptocephala]